MYTAARILSRDGSLSEPIFADRAPRDGRIFGPLLSECFVHISTTLVRRAEFEAVGGFDETLSAPVEDYDLWLRLARRTGARMVREPLVSIRRHDGCISSTRELAVWRDTLLILGRTRRGGGLGVGERLRVRRSMARAHTRLSVLQAKDPVTRRRHLASALRLNPLQRTGWREVAAVLAARPWRRDSP